MSGCFGRCGAITNADWVPHTVSVAHDGHRLAATIVPHGKVSFRCGSGHDCAVELGGAPIAIQDDVVTDVRIEHGTLRVVGH
jgi:hypothetical protein